MVRRSCGLVIVLVASAVLSAACGAPRPTVADPGWTAIDPASLPTQLAPSEKAWEVVLPAGSPFQGAAIKAAPEWYALSRVDSAASGTVASVWVGDARTGALTGRPTEIPDALGQIVTFDVEDRPISLVPVRPDGGPISLVAFDPASGRELWTRPGTVSGAPDPDAYFHVWGVVGAAVIGQVSGPDERRMACAVCALDLATGRVLWSHQGVSPASPQSIGTVAVGGDAVVAVLGGETVALDARGGDVLFRTPARRPADPQWTSALAGTDAVVLMEQGDGSGVAVVVRDLSGRQLWSTPTSTQPLFDRATGALVVTAPSGDVETRDLVSGQVRWSIPAGTASRDAVSLAFADDGRVVANARGTTVAYDARSGDLLWASQFAKPNSSEWNGSTYITWDRDGALAAFRGESEPLGVDLSLGLELPIFLEPRSA